MRSFTILLMVLTLYQTISVFNVNKKKVETKKDNNITLEYNDKALRVIMRKSMGNSASCLDQFVEKEENIYTLNTYQLKVHEIIIDDWHTTYTVAVSHQFMPYLTQNFIYQVTWKDTTAPTMTLYEEEVYLYTDSVFDPTSYTKEVLDNKDTQPTYVCEYDIPMIDNQYEVGTYPVLYCVQDNKNNQSQYKLVVHIIEKEMPVLAYTSDNEMVSLAFQQLNKAYVWGSRGPNTFDCSGLILYVYEQSHYSLTWSQIQYGLGKLISLDSQYWQVGDVLSYTNANNEVVHHALYLGNGLVIHATTDGVMLLLSNECLTSQTLYRVNRFL